MPPNFSPGGRGEVQDEGRDGLVDLVLWGWPPAAGGGDEVSGTLALTSLNEPEFPEASAVLVSRFRGKQAPQ